MTVGSVVLLVAVAGLVAAVDLAYRPRRWQMRHPALALHVQVGLFGLAGLLGSLLVLFVLRRGVADGPRGGKPLLVDVLPGMGAWALLFLLGGALAALLAHRDALAHVDRVTADALTDVITAGGYERRRRRGATVTFVDSPQPFAASMRFAGRHVVMTRGLRDRLTPPEVEAVLAHEEYHLVACHDHYVRAVRLLSACLPWSACRGHERRVRLLVELACDDYAARTCGRRAVTGALEQLSDLGPATGAAVRAERLRRR